MRSVRRVRKRLPDGRIKNHRVERHYGLSDLCLGSGSF
ncbi:hypothetical protein V8L73_13670 [Leminorella grimontii]|nr:hypothetical protein [Leminorella grimontii]